MTEPTSIPSHPYGGPLIRLRILRLQMTARPASDRCSSNVTTEDLLLSRVLLCAAPSVRTCTHMWAQLLLSTSFVMSIISVHRNSKQFQNESKLCSAGLHQVWYPRARGLQLVSSLAACRYVLTM
mmetsp:Transcript_26346/g.43168  ORF Transcript_26346/g.43168 Transcript_26346/m.43168 type:complete len:125 (+) Transcript_26346:1632-2006(+)